VRGNKVTITLNSDDNRISQIIQLAFYGRMVGIKVIFKPSSEIKFGKDSVRGNKVTITGYKYIMLNKETFFKKELYLLVKPDSPQN
jgi:hypothetical protein